MVFDTTEEIRYNDVEEFGMKLNPQFVVDDQGQKAAVLLPVEQYNELLEALEDRLDAGDLEDAVREDSEFVPYEQIQERLRSEGKL